MLGPFIQIDPLIIHVYELGQDGIRSIRLLIMSEGRPLKYLKTVESEMLVYRHSTEALFASC